MREIKFRAWSTADNKMFYDVYFDNLEVWLWEINEWNNISTIGDRYEGSLLKPAILMQYTGLKDRNGTEIYEGDVVKASIYSDDEKSFEVRWVNCAFVIDYEDSEADMYEIGGFPGQLEVIGNIYEEARDEKTTD